MGEEEEDDGEVVKAAVEYVVEVEVEVEGEGDLGHLKSIMVSRPT